MPTEEIWKLQQEAIDILSKVQLVLAGPTMSSEDLDYCTDAIAHCHRVLRFCDEELGLS